MVKGTYGHTNRDNDVHDRILTGFLLMAYTEIDILRVSVSICSWLTRSSARKFAAAKSKRAGRHRFRSW